MFTSTNTCQGSHVQITARSDRDLTPESIIKKVADASGANYSGASAPSSSNAGPPPPVASKPVFQPSQSGGGQRGFAPLASRSRPAASTPADDENDGWGASAPQVSRSQLEKVESSYKPTKVNMSELTSQKQEPSRFKAPEPAASNNDDVVRGGYQPVGKIDIAALRRQAQGSGSTQDDRPTTVKGAYEPVGKVDIAAIRARAAPSSPDPVSSMRTGGSTISANKTGGSAQGTPDSPSSLADRSAAFNSSERMTSMPKPKVANKFGSSSGSFAGTRAPSYGAPITSAGLSAPGRSMSSAAGKTPAQLWAEKKAAQGGAPAPAPSSVSAASPVAAQKSGGFESGYAGKKWGAVQIPKPGRESMPDDAEEPAAAEEEEEAEAPRPPPMNMSSKPNAGGRGVPMPGMPRPVPTPQEEEGEDEPAQEPAVLPVPPPPQPPRSPEPEEDENDDEYARPSSPIRVAMPIGRAAAPIRAPSERFEPQPLPTRSLAQVVPHEDELEEEPQEEEEDTARHAAQAAATSTFGAAAVQQPNVGGEVGGKKAIAQFDYEKAEENELELHEGEEVTNIEMVDEDWWMGENSRGEKGLFPSNYVELVEGGGSAGGAAAPAAPVAHEEPAAHAHEAPAAASHAPAAPEPSGGGATATAQFDYEAVEDNELSFPDGATIENVVSDM